MNVVCGSWFAGVFLNNATLKTEAKRFVTEWVRFGMYADGTNNDASKLIEDNYVHANQYMAYSPGTLSILGQVIDAFARAGDTSLYDYSTSVGNCGTAGGPKTFLLAMIENAKYVDHTWLRHGTNNATNATNPNWLIDTNSEVDGNNTVTEHSFAQMNMYYQSAYLTSIYRRTAPGQNGYTVPGYPSSPAGTCCYYPWGSGWGVMPGTLFMFGQMEVRVS